MKRKKKLIKKCDKYSRLFIAFKRMFYSISLCIERRVNKVVKMQREMLVDFKITILFLTLINHNVKVVSQRCHVSSI